MSVFSSYITHLSLSISSNYLSLPLSLYTDTHTQPHDVVTIKTYIEIIQKANQRKKKKTNFIQNIRTYYKYNKTKQIRNDENTDKIILQHEGTTKKKEPHTHTIITKD